MRHVWTVLALFVVACGTEPASPDAPRLDAGAGSQDAGPGVDTGPSGDAGGAPDAGATPPGILIGTGLSRFEPLSPGATLDLVAGPQGGGQFGGHHVLVALRLEGLTQDDLETLRVRLVDMEGRSVGLIARDPARTPFVAGRELPNLQPRVEDCCSVAGRPLTIEVTSRTRAGDELRSTFEGTASACPNASQGPSICP